MVALSLRKTKQLNGLVISPSEEINWSIFINCSLHVLIIFVKIEPDVKAELGKGPSVVSASGFVRPVDVRLQRVYLFDFASIQVHL